VCGWYAKKLRTFRTGFGENRYENPRIGSEWPLADFPFTLHVTCADELIQIVCQAQHIFITFEATCFDLIYRSSSGLHTMEFSNAMHVGIPSYSYI
jgi:hypothetical protein